MPYAEADLVQEVAERLGVVGDGQTAEPEDAAKIRRALPGIVADLAGRDIYLFATLTEIDPAAYLHLAAIVAGALTDRFGVDQNDTVVLASRAQTAEQKLRYLRSLPYARTPARPCYF